MRQPFIYIPLGLVLWIASGSIAPAQSLPDFGCDSRSGCTYPIQTLEPALEGKAAPKRRVAPVEEIVAPPEVADAGSIIPVALSLSLAFAPPPLQEPRASPTTCLVERSFSDVPVAASKESDDLKPRLFERGVQILAGRVEQITPSRTNEE